MELLFSYISIQMEHFTEHIGYLHNRTVNGIGLVWVGKNKTQRG